MNLAEGENLITPINPPKIEEEGFAEYLQRAPKKRYGRDDDFDSMEI